MIQRRARYSNIEILSLLFMSLQVINVIGYFSQNNNMESLFSLASQGYILVCFIAFLVAFLTFPNAFNKDIRLFWLIWMAIGAAISYWLHPSGGIYQFLIVLFGYLSLPLYMLWVPFVPQNKRILQVITFGAVCTALYFVGCFIFAPEYATQSGALLLGYSNQNRLAIYLVNNIGLLLALSETRKNKQSKFVMLALCVLETYMLYLTLARTAYLCGAFLWLTYFLRNKWKLKKQIISLAMWLPLLTVFVILFLYSSSAIPKDAMLFGKPLFSGREGMFLYFLSSMRGTDWLVGNWERYQLGNLHNSFMTIICSLGCVGVIFFFSFFYQAMVRFWKILEDNPVRMLAFAGILILFLEGVAESATLVSGAMYASAVAPMIYLMHYQKDNTSV